MTNVKNKKLNSVSRFCRIINSTGVTTKRVVTYLLTYFLTYLLTPWSRVLLEKLTGLLRWILRKWDVEVLTGSSWLRIGTGGGHL